MLTQAITGTERVIKSIQRDIKQTRFAAAVALTRTGKVLKGDEEKEIAKVFDRPKPFTTKSTYMVPAKKDNLEVRVGIKDKTAQYLSHHVKKRDRAVKGIEKYMRRKGLLPQSMYVVPGNDVRLNRYGNLTLGMYRKIVDGALTRGSKYFAANINGTKAIWQRYGRGGRKVKPVLVFVRKPSYRKRFNFYRVAEDTFNKRLDGEFTKAWEQAMRSAR
jgi:hypothetical protein